jgi:hypothetical protein
VLKLIKSIVIIEKEWFFRDCIPVFKVDGATQLYLNALVLW